jgi:eukaryotic-like serine/threonine-protein kinase
MKRGAFRLFYAALLAAVFAVAGWEAFQRFLVGRSVLTPDLTGKSVEEARKLANDIGLSIIVDRERDRFDAKVPARHVLLQKPSAGTFVKPGQALRVALSKGPEDIRVPDLAGMSARAATLALARASLGIGDIATARLPLPVAGIVAQSPDPDQAAVKGEPVSMLVNRGSPETVFVMPDLIGRDADWVRMHFEKFGFRVGSARYEAYEGTSPNTILKQFPPAGFPIQRRDVVSLTISRSPMPS